MTCKQWRLWCKIMIICLSASHKTTSLAMFGAINIQDEETFMRIMQKGCAVQECVLIQTCHRIEVFCISSDANKTAVVRGTLKLWSTITGVSFDIIDKAVQIYYGKEALKHLFFLTSGIDSIVIGEAQILGQVRAAWLKAKTNGATGTILNRTFMKAINIGKQIRNKTKINEGAMSISSAAIDLAAKELGSLESRKVLVVGAGETGSLAAYTLKSKAASIIIANRTYKKSQLLAKKISGEAIQFDNILSILPVVDLVIVAISITQPLVRKEQLTSFADKLGNPKRLLIIDISQPHAIDEEVKAIKGVNLKTIEDLKEIVARNMKNREIEAEKSKVIILEELNRFEAELSKLVAQPLIVEIYRKFEEIRRKELGRAVRKMGETDERKLAIMDRFSKELIERIAQIPIEQLKTATLNNNDEVLAIAKLIFQIQK